MPSTELLRICANMIHSFVFSRSPEIRRTISNDERPHEWFGTVFFGSDRLPGRSGTDGSRKLPTTRTWKTNASQSPYTLNLSTRENLLKRGFREWDKMGNRMYALTARIESDLITDNSRGSGVLLPQRSGTQTPNLKRGIFHRMQWHVPSVTQYIPL